MVIELQPALAVGRNIGFSDADVVEFDWVSDERLVFSARNLEAGSADDQRVAKGLFAVDFDGKAFRNLVARRVDAAFATPGTKPDEGLDWNHILLHVPLAQKGVTPDEVVIGELVFRGRVLTPAEN